MKVIAVMPAYNEQLMIVDVVDRVRKYVDDIVIVDDGSKDKTTQIVKSLGVRYILHDRNYGAGRATSNGIKAALYHNADIVVTLDSDGQHDPDEIPKLIKPIVDGKADMVIGSRFIQPLGYSTLKKLKMIKVPKYRQFGIKVITWFCNIGSKQKVSDSQCCFRAFNKKALNSIKIEDSGFGLTVEPLIKARCNGIKLCEVPVTCIYHSDYHLNSTMHPVRQGLITVLRTIYWRLKLGS